MEPIDSQSRRQLTKSLIQMLGCGVVLGGLTETVSAAQSYVLKVSTFLPPNHTFQKALVIWGRELEHKRRSA